MKKNQKKTEKYYNVFAPERDRRERKVLEGLAEIVCSAAKPRQKKKTLTKRERRNRHLHEMVSALASRGDYRIRNTCR